MTKQTCPRRMTDFGPWEREENLDRWRSGTSFAKYANDPTFRNCSFCGSIDPEQFLDFVAQGWVVVPTDKDYKAYLGRPVDPHPLLEGSEVTIDFEEVGKFYFQHLTAEQQGRFVELLNSDQMRLAYPGHFYRKPYFITKDR